MFSISVVEGTASVSVWLLFGLGAVVGLLGGFFGVGGGWIVTPTLNIFGFPMEHAVGTGLAYIFGMSSLSAWKHRKRGALEIKMGFALGLPMVVGIGLGKLTMVMLKHYGNPDQAVRAIYVVFLIGLGLFMLWDSVRRPQGYGSGLVPDDAAESGRKPWLQIDRGGLRLYLPKSDITLSLVPILVIGVFVGYLSGLMGAGGGFILMPIMLYLAGMPTVVAVGTSLVCVLIASPFGVLVYWLDSQVAIVAAGLMVAGALVGAPVGVHASHKVQGPILRLLYAIMIIIGGISVILKELAVAYPEAMFEAASRLVILCAAGGMATLIIILMLLAGTRERKKMSAEPT